MDLVQKHWKKEIFHSAPAGNRTPIKTLATSHSNHWTTSATWWKAAKILSTRFINCSEHQEKTFNGFCLDSRRSEIELGLTADSVWIGETKHIGMWQALILCIYNSSFNFAWLTPVLTVFFTSSPISEILRSTFFAADFTFSNGPHVHASFWLSIYAWHPSDRVPVKNIDAWPSQSSRSFLFFLFEHCDIIQVRNSLSHLSRLEPHVP